ncbi:MAG: oligosaccharide flippase family protein [Clostridia bacterium]|nr:oligosaccharide flippase family protein [Clostridia bacterium]
MSHNKLGGVSLDAIFLTFIKLVTTGLSLIITRLLSEYLSVYDYGVYSQALLIVSTVSSFTIFGMMDGINYFYCSESDIAKRESYTATIFTMQCAVSAAAGAGLLILSVPLCEYLGNPGIQRLLVFVAMLPLLQNVLGIIQVLMISVGKARMLALRNFVISAIRLAVVFVVVTFVRNVAIILATTVILDIIQIAVFLIILKKNGCNVKMLKTDFRLVPAILKYCAPMAVFTIVSSLNRDMDKYLVSIMTDTKTLALYANASKQLPFDILMTSFCTVLIPYITKYISEQKKKQAAGIYKLFLEITYISTAVLCCAALAASPQLMKLLYSNKYTEGIEIFVIYILVDLFRFTNITLVLSAAGKTRTLMMIGLGAVCCNLVLNPLMYGWFGLIGPAVATLIVTVMSGILMLYFNSRALECKITEFFDMKYLALFAAESVALTVALSFLSKWLDKMDVHYFIILVSVAGLYGIIMLVLNGKRLLKVLKKVNRKSLDG